VALNTINQATNHQYDNYPVLIR